MENSKKVVLAYSGGVDTSACIPYLKNESAPLKIPYTGVNYNQIKD